MLKVQQHSGDAPVVVIAVEGDQASAQRGQCLLLEGSSLSPEFHGIAVSIGYASPCQPRGRPCVSVWREALPGFAYRSAWPSRVTLPRCSPIKKLGRFDRVGHRITGDRTGQSNSRGVGWEFVPVAIDDASRIAFSLIMPDQKKQSAVAFLKAALAYYHSLGLTVARVMTDNGSCYRAFDFRDACHDRGLRHIRTKPDTPKTNGKAERFIQTALREWACAQAYPTSQRSAEELPFWLHLQLASTARRDKITNAHQSPRPLRGQPVEAPHLAGRDRPATQDIGAA